MEETNEKKVIVIMEIQHFSRTIHVSRELKGIAFDVYDDFYFEDPHILGVYEDAQTATEELNARKEHLKNKYGKQCLDDDHIKDGHTYYTYCVGIYRVESREEKME